MHRVCCNPCISPRPGPESLPLNRLCDVNLQMPGLEVSVQLALCPHWWICKHEDRHVHVHLYTHIQFLPFTLAHSTPVSRWLWGHKVPSDSISTKVILSLQRRITRPFSAFLLKHNSPHLASWHHISSLLLCHPYHGFLSLHLAKNMATITLFYFSPSLQCTTFQPLPLHSLFNAFFVSSAFLSSFLLTSKVRQDKQCHWCLSECDSLPTTTAGVAMETY